MKNMLFVVFMTIMMVTGTLMFQSCSKQPEIQMPEYTPESISYLNGKAFAILSAWKKEPSKGSYLVLYDLEKLKVAKVIPLSGVIAFLYTVYYWNGKYVFLSWATSEVGILDAETGKIKMLSVVQPGLGLGVTKAGYFYVVSNGYDREKGCGISIINVE